MFFYNSEEAQTAIGMHANLIINNLVDHANGIVLSLRFLWHLFMLFTWSLLIY